MAENTREIVLDILLTLEKSEEFSHKLIKSVLDKYNYLEERDKAFIKRAAEGTIERKLELDYYLDAFSNVPVKKMKPLIRCLMRMSVYQILYMDNVPDSAVCNEACKLAQKRKFTGLKGFVNGVLRNISRQKQTLPLPDEKKHPIAYLSVKYSMPEWLIQLWLDAYGWQTTEKMLKGLLRIHPVSLRLRTDVSEEERQQLIHEMEAAGCKLTGSSLLPYVYYTENSENLSNLPGYAEGRFVVQDVSSAMAVEAAGLSCNDFVIDLCAAPGGKSMLAAEKAGRVLARDVSAQKTTLITENIGRMKLENITVQVHDATVKDSMLEEQADVVLADVPCSGLGVIGKKRDIKYHITPEKIASINALQKQIIQNSWSYVKPGGVLLYSTCTIHPDENEKMTKWIMEQFPFELESQKQFIPGVDETDGFYYAKLRRKKQ